MYDRDMGNTFRADSSSAPVNLIPFRPLISNPLEGMTGTTPCGVGNTMRPEPGVAPPRRNPGLYATTPLALRRGNRKWTRMGADGRGWTRMDADGRGPISASGNAAGGRAIAVSPPGILKAVPCPIPLRESQRDHDCGDGRGPISPSGNAAGGRAIAVPPPGIPKAVPCPIPLRESQRDSAMKPGVAPPRRYPGSMPNISTTLKGLCKRAVHSGQFLGRTFQSRQSSSIPMMVQMRTAHSPASQPWFWAMDPRPLPWTTRPT